MRRSFGWQNPELSRAFTLEDKLKHLKLSLSFQKSNLCFLLFPFFFLPPSFPSLRLLSFPPASFPPFLLFFFSFYSSRRILPLLPYSPLFSCLFHFLFPLLWILFSPSLNLLRFFFSNLLPPPPFFFFFRFFSLPTFFGSFLCSPSLSLSPLLSSLSSFSVCSLLSSFILKNIHNQRNN